MRKLIQAIWALTFVLTVFPLPQEVQAESTSHAPDFSTASELISAVNALRATYGLAPYQTNSILMGTAQAQAQYVASTGNITHISANGMHPFQRALAAGYPVAGDLNQGGWFSENISTGAGQTAEEAVEVWTGDDPHKNTMLSGMLQDVGAGVGISGDIYYYVLDSGRSTGGAPVAYTPPAPGSTGVPIIIPNTPNADGSIVHIARGGDTLGSISLAYDVPLADILKLNNLKLKSVIYVGQKIILRAAYTPTPTLPTSTPTAHPTITSWPTSTPTFTATRIPPTPTPSPGLSVSTAGGAVSIIIIAALLIAGLITLLGRKRKR